MGSITIENARKLILSGSLITSGIEDSLNELLEYCFTTDEGYVDDTMQLPLIAVGIIKSEHIEFSSHEDRKNFDKIVTENSLLYSMNNNAYNLELFLNSVYDEVSYTLEESLDNATITEQATLGLDRVIEMGIQCIPLFSMGEIIYALSLNDVGMRKDTKHDNSNRHWN